METETLFTPEYKVLNTLFGRDTKYIIPEYQRPYSWDCIGKSDKNNQVNVMWEDLITYFESKNPNPYFLGSMVFVGSSSNEEYQVIDGQQRLTTLVLLFISIKCFLLTIKKNKQAEEDVLAFINAAVDQLDSLVFNKTIFGVITQEKKVKIARQIGFNYDHVLKTVMECGQTGSVDTSQATEEEKIVSNRYFTNRKYLEGMIREKFMKKNTFALSDAENLNNYIDFLKKKVAVVRILATRFDIAYQVFEILNNRGLPLSNKDLFRNFLIKEFHKLQISNPDKYPNLNPANKWYELEESFDLDNEFVSRWVESKKASKQQYSAFNDLQELFEKKYTKTLQKAEIELFYDEIITDLGNYTQIKGEQIENKTLRYKILFLLNTGNPTYSLNLLISLFRHCNYEEKKPESIQKILTFIIQYERYIMYYLLGPSKRFVGSRIYTAIKDLNEGSYKKAIQCFELNQDEIEDLNKLINNPIKDNKLAKLFIAKYIWIQNAEIKDDLVEMVLNYNYSTLEHIIPQKPSRNSNWTKDFDTKFRNHFTYKLGNMTLLTQKNNSSAKNYDFEEKKKRYLKTKLSITRDIATQETLNQNWFENRHYQIITSILKDIDIIFE